eukprot:CAMPEP_0204845694 /NCGR_PEP_ID=MMETSP1347-20130617/1379_1 /ASSEMBLY_ACC=CAM_ASM_000690 /TAXON_ID=215587 /ORGANISM="Aplanochytrium stocchinoi, Strain GSBS06" /LENGTH=86 /DNA_ID=CAMNT_0051985891 /DNA_START=15 /DNA_END=275 /DNA_ORIENTATION=-
MTRSPWTRNPFMRSGLPVLIFCVAGSFGLGQLVQGKKDIEDLKSGKRSLTTREFDLEEDYKRTLNKLNVDEYEVIRIKRPEDETET